ncbi:MAG TPA: hypothetical protein VJY43_00585 [Methanocorpusculum sp.]|nr:hypothetical protein [Methanocorpusculum sp.]
MFSPHFVGKDEDDRRGDTEEGGEPETVFSQWVGDAVDDLS